MVGELPWSGASSTSGLATGSDARRQTGSTATGTAGCSERVDASLRVQGAGPTRWTRSSARVGFGVATGGAPSLTSDVTWRPASR
jgi:hypothetical protein